MQSRVISVTEAGNFPPDFVQAGEKVFELVPDNITNFLAERPPQQYITQAIINTRTQAVCSPYTIQRSDCMGHLCKDGTERLFVPLARLAQVMGQVGSLMCLFEDMEIGQTDSLVLAKNVSEVGTSQPRIQIGESKAKLMFLVPGLPLQIVAEPIEDDSIHAGSAMTTVFCFGRIVTRMRVDYTIMPYDSFVRFYDMQQQKLADELAKM